METWVTINEEILKMERENIKGTRWNELMEKARKTAGCLRRKYEEPKRTKGRKKRTKERRKKKDVETLS